MAKAAEFSLGANFGQVKAQLNEVVAAMGKNVQAMQRFENRVSKTEGKMHRLARAQKSAFSGPAMSGLTNYVGGLVSVGGAVATLTGSWDRYLRVVERSAKATNAMHRSAVTFADIQEPGTRAERVKAVRDLAAQAGAGGDYATAFSTVQSLQSAIGSQNPALSNEQAFQQGLAAARKLYQLQDLGVPLAVGAAAERQGIAQGMRPGQLAQMLYLAGRRAFTTPEDLATAAQSLQFFDHPELGIAVAAGLSGFGEGDLKTLLKNAGRGLGMTGSAKGYWTREGLAEATQGQRLEHLARVGFDSAEKVMAGMGVTSAEEAQSLAGAVQTISVARQALADLRAAVGSEDMLAKRRAELEGELPGLRIERETRQLQSRTEDLRISGVRAQRHRERVLTGTALERIGAHGTLMLDFVDDEGKATKTGMAVAEGWFPGLDWDEAAVRKVEEEFSQRFPDYEPPQNWFLRNRVSQAVQKARMLEMGYVVYPSTRPGRIPPEQRPESRDRYADDREEVVRQR